jgi:hypothetical protein
MRSAGRPSRRPGAASRTRSSATKGRISSSPFGSTARIMRTIAGDGADPAYSPDGRWIAFLRGGYSKGNVSVARPDVSDRHRLKGVILADSVDWSPTGDRLVLGSEFTGIMTINPDGSGQRTIVPGDQSSPVWASWSPDGRSIPGTLRPGLTTISLATGQQRFVHGAVGSLAWQPRP